MPASSPPLLPATLPPPTSSLPPFLQSINTVLAEPKDYTLAFPSTEPSKEDVWPTINLAYPDPRHTEVYPLAKPKVAGGEVVSEGYDPVQDILSTVAAVARYILPDEPREGVEAGSVIGDSPSIRGRRILRDLRIAVKQGDRSTFERRIALYNQLIRDASSMSGGLENWVKAESKVMSKCPGGEADDPRKKGIPYDLVVHILLQVYNRVVSPQVEKLLQYKAFSNNVYGEINPMLTHELMLRCGVDADSIFVDLGCGIGNVVIQAAAQTGCEAYGVEIMHEPARLGQAQVREFAARSTLYGLSNGRAEVIQGDFLEEDKVAAILARATVVLANNYAFDSTLNQRLLQLFLELQDGAKIISLRSFVPPRHRITERNAGSMESILRVKSFRYSPGSVSWTGNAGIYYVHEVDRRPVEEFWRNQFRPRR